MMKAYSSLDDFIADLPVLTEGVSDQLKGHDGLFQLQCGEKSWFIDLEDGRATVSHSADQCPLCIIMAEEQLALDMVCGKVSPMKALLFGKVTVRGDVKPLLRLCSLL